MPVWEYTHEESSNPDAPRVDGEYPMKFTILSHAGLLVEHAGVRVVCDPWLTGSCYWRSWWNFPEPDPALIGELRADFVYLTHLHWDHFHGPSLRRLFSPQTRVLVPKVPTRRMLEDLRYLGFENIIEIPHGGSFELAPDFMLRSYQFGLGVDSAAVLAGGGVTLFNCNDAKFFGLPLRQILGDFPRIDFLLRSHSSAGPIPFCVENYERLPREMLVQSDSADQFVRCALHVGARYAVPFASNHCFLHRETIAFNGTATTPEEVRRHYQEVAAKVGSRTECVVMPPGSSWSDQDGFRIQPFDFAARTAYIESMLSRHGEKLAACYAEEDRTLADFESFRDYFQRMMLAIPRFIRRRALAPIVFEVRDASGRRFWRIDPLLATVQELLTPPAGDVVIEVHAAVLRDCSRNRMFSVWSASKRLKIKLPGPQALAAATRWLTFLDLYELETLPLARNFSPRSLAIRLRRWREPVELASLLLRRALLHRPTTITSLYPLKAT
jgi:UDP-MurNAc hydroxylase